MIIISQNRFEDEYLEISMRLDRDDAQVQLLAPNILRVSLGRSKTSEIGLQPDFSVEVMEVVIRPDPEHPESIARPAWQFSDMTYGEPTIHYWRWLQEGAFRERLETAAASTGQLWHRETFHGSMSVRWSQLGTAWVCAPGLLATNRHIVDSIRGENLRDIFIDFSDLQTKPDSRIRVDFPEALETEIAEDLAFLSFSPDSSTPPPLKIATKDPSPGDFLAIIGFPGTPNSLEAQKIFRQPYFTKKLSPGVFMRLDESAQPWQAWTDASTLLGSSGSPIIDPGSGRVSALHYNGIFLIRNYAVKASAIRRRLAERGVELNT